MCDKEIVTKKPLTFHGRDYLLQPLLYHLTCQNTKTCMRLCRNNTLGTGLQKSTSAVARHACHTGENSAQLTFLRPMTKPPLSYHSYHRSIYMPLRSRYRSLHRYMLTIVTARICIGFSLEWLYYAPIALFYRIRNSRGDGKTTDAPSVMHEPELPSLPPRRGGTFPRMEVVYPLVFGSLKGGGHGGCASARGLRVMGPLRGRSGTMWSGCGLR